MIVLDFVIMQNQVIFGFNESKILIVLLFDSGRVFDEGDGVDRRDNGHDEHRVQDFRRYRVVGPGSKVLVDRQIGHDAADFAQPSACNK